MEREEIKNDILNWLSKETAWNIQISIDTLYYFVCIVKMSERMGCNICIEKNIDRVDVIANGKFSKEDNTNYKLSPKHEKERFWTTLKLSIIPLNVNIEPIPDIENLETIQIAKLIYFDGWSQNRLINTMLKVTNALESAELIYRNFSERMNQQDSRA